MRPGSAGAGRSFIAAPAGAQIGRLELEHLQKFTGDTLRIVPHIVGTADGGLTVDGIVASFKKVFGTRLENFGLMKKPYAFYDGVKLPEKE